MKCFIFCSGKITSYSWLKSIDFSDSFIICADGGFEHAKKLGLEADVWMGDGDSLKNIKPVAKKIVTFPSKKDNTDTDLAIMYALESGFKDITILGGLGGRIDHEYSHFCLLKKVLENGATATLIDEKNTITMKNESFELYPNGRKYVSFFPFGGDIKNFSIKGLLYEAEGLTLENGKVQASSNEFLNEKKARISFDSGFLLVISSDD